MLALGGRGGGSRQERGDTALLCSSSCPVVRGGAGSVVRNQEWILRAEVCRRLSLGSAATGSAASDQSGSDNSDHTQTAFFLAMWEMFFLPRSICVSPTSFAGHADWKISLL